MGADPDFFITRKLAKTEQGLSFFGKEALAEYMRCFRNPATIHAMCEDYRATAGVDLAMDTADYAAGRKIETPLLLLWGATGAVGRNPQAGRRSGRTMPPTSRAPRRCHAGIICRRKPPRRPTARCTDFSRAARRLQNLRRSSMEAGDVPRYDQANVSRRDARRNLPREKTMDAATPAAPPVRAPAHHPWYTILYVQVLVAIALGVAARILRPEARAPAEAARRRLYRADQDDDRAGHLLHHRAWHRVDGRSQEGRPRRHQDAVLFRSGFDAGAGHRLDRRRSACMPGNGFNIDPTTLDPKLVASFTSPAPKKTAS